MQASCLYDKLGDVARGGNILLSVAAGMVGEMRRAVASEWWGQKMDQRASCPHYLLDDLESIEDLLAAAGVTDAAVVAAMVDVKSLALIKKGIELSSQWVKDVAAKKRTGPAFIVDGCTHACPATGKKL